MRGSRYSEEDRDSKIPVKINPRYDIREHVTFGTTANSCLYTSGRQSPAYARYHNRRVLQTYLLPGFLHLRFTGVTTKFCPSRAGYQPRLCAQLGHRRTCPSPPCLHRARQDSGRTPRVSHCTCPLLSQRSEGACAPRNRHPVFPERLGESSTLWQKSLTVSSWQPYLSQQRTVVSFILYFRVATLIGIRRPRPKGVGVKSSSVRPFVRIVAGTGCGRHLFITQRFSSQLSTAC